MYICPTCNKEFDSKDLMAKHILSCWKNEHPYHRSKEAPHSEDLETREVSDDILGFFNSFIEEK